MISKKESRDNILDLSMNIVQFPIPSFREIATISGQLSYLAQCARNFGMRLVAINCDQANQELGLWVERNLKDLDTFEKGAR